MTPETRRGVNGTSGRCDVRANPRAKSWPRSLLASPKVHYSAMSAATGFVELGGPITLLRGGHGLVSVVGAGLAYQLGALIARRVRSRRIVLVITGFSIALLVMFVVTAGEQPWFMVLATGALAVNLQYGRRRAQEAGGRVSATLKRTWRILGFVVAGSATAIVFICLAALSLMLAVGSE